MLEENRNQPTAESTPSETPATFANVVGAGAAAVGNKAKALGQGAVDVAGDVHAPIVTGSGNIIQSITQYISNPPTLQVIYQDFGRFLNRNRLNLGLTILLEIPLGITFFVYKDRFLIPWWVYLSLALLLVALVQGWLKLFLTSSSNAREPLFFLTGISGLIWVSLLGWQIQTILFPARFSPSEFGIAIATIGEGANFRVTPRGHEISNLLHGQLHEAILNTPELSNVKLARIGIVRNIDQGRSDGERIGAKLVIWGQILERGDETIIHFQVLETLGITDNPSIPQTMPLVRRSLQTNVGLQSADSLTIRNVVSLQSLAVTSFSLGMFYYLDLDYDNAVEQFERTLTHLEEAQAAIAATDLGLVYFYLGRSYQLLGAFDQSQAMFNQAAELNPDDPAIVLGQAYNYRVLGQEKQQQQALERAIALTYKLPRDEVPALYDRALAYEMLKDDEAALREYRAINKLAPDFFIAYLNAGRILMQLGRLDEAEEIYQKAQDLAEGDPSRQVWVYVDKGRLYQKRGQTDLAIEAYHQAIALNNSLVTPYFELAQLYDKLGITDGAYLNYKKLTEISQNPSWTHGLFADYLLRQKNYPQAVEHYKEALRYPAFDAPRLYADLGQAYAYADEEDFPDREALSLAQFEKALQNPSPYETYIRSIYGQILYFKFRCAEEAIIQHERSLELDPSIGVETRLNLGQIYEEMGEVEKAKEQYQLLIEKGDQIPKDRLQIAQNRLKALEGIRNIATKNDVLACKSLRTS